MSNGLRRVPVALGIAGAFLGACSTAEVADGPAIDDPAVEARARQTEDQSLEGSSGSTADASMDMCEVVSPDDLATVLETVAPAGDLNVGDPTPLVAGECSFAIERPGTGASQVQVRVGDDSVFGHHRDIEDVTDKPGLGEEAYWFHGVAGPELHVRHGGTWLGVRFGSYDDRLGMTDDSHDQIATMVLDRLTGG